MSSVGNATNHDSAKSFGASGRDAANRSVGVGSKDSAKEAIRRVDRGGASPSDDVPGLADDLAVAIRSAAGVFRKPR